MLKDDLIKIQSELKCPKDQYNSFGKFSYRSCEQILEAAKPLLQSHNVLLSLSDDVSAVNGDTYIKATATVSKGDESISVTAFAREEKDKKGMDASQMTGTASSLTIPKTRTRMNSSGKALHRKNRRKSPPHDRPATRRVITK